MRGPMLGGWAFFLVACSSSHAMPAPCVSATIAPCVCSSGARGTQVCTDGRFDACRCDGVAERCTAGEEVACACTDGDVGTQRCTTAGVFGTCDCDGTVGPACTPGQSVACNCASGAMGAQICDDAGVFAPCLCETAPCIPGMSVACSCTDGSAGAQTCDASGAFGACVCEDEPPIDGGGIDAGAGLDAGSSDAALSRPDAPRLDAGPRRDVGCGDCGALGVHCGHAIDPCGAVLECGACSVTSRSLAIDANDIVYDRSRDLVFASVAGTAGVRGNSVIAVDPSTASIVWSTFVGSDPTAVVLDGDGRCLWVALSTGNAVRSLDLDTHAAGPTFTLGTSSFGESLTAWAMAALPSGGLAVARVESGSRYFESLAVYDEGVERPVTTDLLDVRAGDSLVAIDDALVIGFNNSDTGFDLTRYDIDATGVRDATNHRSLVSGFRQTISFDGAHVIGSGGEVIDPVAMARLGTCTPAGGSGRESLQGAVGDAATQRVYAALGGTFSSDPVTAIVAFDQSTFTEVARVTPSGIGGEVVRSQLQPGVGLVLLTPGDSFDRTVTRIWFLDTDLVAGP